MNIDTVVAKLKTLPKEDLVRVMGYIDTIQKEYKGPFKGDDLFGCIKMKDDPVEVIRKMRDEEWP